MTETTSLIAKELKELLVKRSSVKGRITKYKTYLNSISSSNSLTSLEVGELKVKTDKIKKVSEYFDELQNRIEVLNSDNLSMELSERDSIEQDFAITIATGQHLIDSNEINLNTSHLSAARDDRGDHSTSIVCHHDNQNMGFKLPQMQISKFDGAFFKWLEFRDTFLSLIHNNERIKSIHKFHYLVSYLEGEAARIISNIELSEANYSNAWQLLCERYDNKKHLINHHLNSLLNIEPFARETEKSLRFLIDHVSKNLRALATLGQPTEYWDTLIIHFASSKLDILTLGKWEEHRSTFEEVPTLKQFNKFLSDRADVLEILNRNKSKQPSRPAVPPFRNNLNINTERQLRSFAVTNTTNTYLCPACKGEHRIFNCPTFLAKTVEDRKAEVSKLRLCPNCLKPASHSLRFCRSRACRHCNNKTHNSLLCLNSKKDTEDSPINSCFTTVKNNNQIILSTALITVTNAKTNQSETVKALLDCGSQSTFISKSLKQKLSLDSQQVNTINIIGIGDNHCNKVTETCIVQINSTNNNFNISLTCYVMDKLTGPIPKMPISIEGLNFPTSVRLADPSFDQPSPIDVLIGADIFWDILGCDQISLGPNNPKLRNSKFGWLIAGPLSNTNSNTKNNTCFANVSFVDEIDKQLTKFWELESVPPNTKLPQNELINDHFLRNTYRLESGRFCVKLPLTKEPICLGDSYNLAKQRFLNLERRLKKQPDIKSQYVDFMREYAELGHLQKSVISKPDPSYFLCHHAVFKANSESTKIRVVFDGSARVPSSGLSINDIQLTGPNIQDSLFSILIRARQYKYILTGDIEKMYRQILINEEHRDLQLILWREDESLPLRTYRLNTVTYGFASASYLSTRCIWQLGEECDNELIKTIIQHDFYVDDLITGADKEEDILSIQKSVSDALKKGGFNLRKYRSNSKAIYECSNINLNENLSISESSSTLGLGWSPSCDTLHFTIDLPSSHQIITKRLILSTSFKIFDPIGLLSPCIIIPKIILQRLWLSKIGWDDPVPDDIKVSWEKFYKNLDALRSVKIPRLALCESPATIEVHSFSDASQSAYGACIYLRSLNQNGDATIKLLCAKSKVAPTKPTTIPRLELNAALLSAKLVQATIRSLRCQVSRFVHWCDSMVVLGWLRSNARSLKTYAANRIVEIGELTEPSSWRYVPTSENPADLLSRGVHPNEIEDSSLWWFGPTFLAKPEKEWPHSKNTSNLVLPEIKSNVVAVEPQCESIIQIDNYSKLTKLKRVTAYILRFINNIRKSKSKINGNLNIDELNNAFYYLCFTAQKQSFADDYATLTKGKPLKSKSNILALSPFIDSHRLIRVGGRIDASSLSYEQKHPILLHSSHHLTKLIFQHYHIHRLHAGPQLLLASVREIIWPINGRRLARNTAQKCVTCRRVRGKTLNPIMGNLPAQRITPDFPFRTVGVDFAGPFMTLNRKGRGARLIKSYLCLFICFRYKCLHLEAVSDLSSNSFILTLRRMISRRGKPQEIFCDNGRNFVGSAREIGKFLKQNTVSIIDFATKEEIKFSFSPCYAPNIGGVWEAGVKSAKYHIKRVMGNTHLTFEELSTLFAQVEAILNSRPLYPLSSSPDDFLALTPGHFLIGRPLASLPSPSLLKNKISSLSRYARLEQIRQHFWKRWQSEYIHELQQRCKWRTNEGPTLQIGDLVLIHEEHVPPLSWRMGRIIRMFPGRDGVSRVADIKTTKGTLRRTLTKICPLLLN